MDFVEKELQCCAIIKQNLKSTGLAAQGHVYCCNVAKALSFLDEKYNIIFMDPPYSDPSAANLLEQLATSKLVGVDSALVIFHSHHLSLATNYGVAHLLKQRRYGDTCVSIYRGDRKP